MPIDPGGETVAEADEAGPRDELKAGEKVGKYRLLRLLGAGGMGVVWAAHDPDLEREVALKLLRRTGNDEARARLQREARAMARLKHPNVLTVYEVARDGDREFIAMELVDGGSLDAWLGQRPSKGEIVAALLAAGRGLAAAHAAGLIHRDFKPHNVLRSRDGRVLVTDFGLARGPGDVAVEHGPPRRPSLAAFDDTLDASSESGSPRRDVLTPGGHDKLTSTGALIGTPAYMSPEQFAGGPPDPRTDQFAFCVTAWQALAGQRPFQGTTIEALIQAVEVGVDGVVAELPRRVRAVLARGLHPDPERRWPSLDALLVAFARATVPRARYVLGGAAVLGVIATITVLALRRPSGDTQPAACRDPLHAFDSAWTASRRDAFVQRTGAIDVANELDDERKQWLSRLASVCAAPNDPRTAVRIECLIGQRDAVAAESDMLDQLPANTVRPFDPAVELPHATVCMSKTPPPYHPPTDPTQRRELAALRVDVARLRHLRQPEQVGRELAARAERLGWPPEVVDVQMLIGYHAIADEDWAAARKAFQSAAEAAQKADLPNLLAGARDELVEVSATALEDPRDPEENTRLVADARSALSHAGSPSGTGRLLDFLVAWIKARHGRLDEALVQLEAARAAYSDVNDLKRRVQVVGVEVEALLERGTADDLTTAQHIIDDTFEKLAHAHRPDADAAVERLSETVAWRRGELATLHASLDRHAGTMPTRGTHRSGRVVDAHGTASAGALIVAWHGELAGDPLRVYADPAPLFPEQITYAAADGTFVIAVPDGGAIIAELDGERSVPQLVSAGEAPLVVRLQATQTLSRDLDVVRVSASRLSVRARYQLANGSAWIERAPVGAANRFTFANLPASTYELEIEGDVGPHAVRTLAPAPTRPLEWMTTRYDVIVRGGRAHANVWLYRGARVPHTRGELRDVLAATNDRVEATTGPIGAIDATADGRGAYLPGDQHAVFVGPDPRSEPVTACAANDVDDTAAVVCAPPGHANVIVIALGR